MLKVVHVSTTLRGGAGIAAYRIHEALLNNGISSHFVCIDMDIPAGRTACTRLQQLPKPESFWKEIGDKIRWRLKHHLNVFLNKRDYCINEFNAIRPAFQCEVAGLPFSGHNILEDPYVQAADIIHLHWTAEMLDYPGFFKHNTRPVVWTLHDMNPFSGLFHYKDDENRNSAVAARLNGLVAAIKTTAIQKRKCRLVFVAPSGWMKTEAENSRFFHGVEGYKISYPINKEVFFPNRDVNLKRTLQVPEANIVFLFVAASADNYRKGFDILMAALEQLSVAVTLLVLGNSENVHEGNLDIRRLGTILDEAILKDYYSIADAFIIPSREDNLPNVMLESLACGTPVISFDIGGMGEIVKENFTGLKAKEINAIALKKVLEEFIQKKDQFQRSKIRDFAVEHFSEELVARKYKEVYSKIAGKKFVEG